MTHDDRVTVAAIAITLALSAVAMWAVLSLSQSLHDRWFDTGRSTPAPSEEQTTRAPAPRPATAQPSREAVAVTEFWLSPQRSRHLTVPATEVTMLADDAHTPQTALQADHREP